MAAAIVGSAAIAESLDPEKLLWVPGAKTFFIPEKLAVRPSLAEVKHVFLSQTMPLEEFKKKFPASREPSGWASKQNAREYRDPLGYQGSRYKVDVVQRGQRTTMEFDGQWNATRGYDWSKQAGEMTSEELAQISHHLRTLDPRKTNRATGQAMLGDDERYIIKDRSMMENISTPDIIVPPDFTGED